jgi:arabinan endo-1,5-alpha-L-arabinosidase
VISPSRWIRKCSPSIPFLCVALLVSCSGAGNSNPPPTGGGGSNPTPSGPDMGTITSVSDNDQFKLQNAATNNLLGITGQSQTAGTNVDQTADGGTQDQLWHFFPDGNGYSAVENMLTHQVLGISGASKSAGAQALEWADNGTTDHDWLFYKLTDGNYLIKNFNSGLYLQVDTSASPMVVDQAARATSGTGCTCQEWKVTDTGTAAYPMPLSVSGSGIYVHDPNMIQDASGTFWLYGTHNTLASSADMTSFTAVSTGDINPDFSWWASENTTGTGGRTDIWAPIVMYANGTYYQYYSIPIYDTPSQAGTNKGAEAVIALATSSNPNGPWVDAGKIISSCGSEPGCTTQFNAIDPAPFIDAAGNWWLSFGSWNDGIHILQLDPTTGLRLASNATLYNIASRAAGEEGSIIYLHVFNGTQYYYYFAPVSICCVGTSSTYRIIIGRSTSATGPFTDRGGLDLSNGGGTVLLSAHANIYGPGGQSVMTVGTQPLLVYHYYDGNNNGTPTLGLNKLSFDSSGWPYIQ